MNKIVLKYTKSFEDLSYSSINQLMKLVDDNIFFCDPFNNFTGKKKFEKLFYEMFKKINNPKFKILNISEDKKIFFVKWNFNGHLKRKFSIDGISEIVVKNNLIVSHIDYWDSGKNFYSHLPFFGYLFRKIHK
tara:strand:- start:318 stop:716 length:399 start_codon:yes stop_codon:yes gene_type:complete